MNYHLVYFAHLERFNSLFINYSISHIQHRFFKWHIDSRTDSLPSKTDGQGRGGTHDIQGLIELFVEREK